MIASDKTGTLTQNEMTARSIFTLAFPKVSFGLTGVGYDVRRSGGYLVRGASGDDLSRMDHASLSSNGGCNATSLNGIGRKVSDRCPEFEALSALFGTASICNNASVSTGDDDDHSTPGGVHMGQPTEMALLVGSAKANVPDPRPMYHRIQEIPFSSDRKRMEVKCRPVGGRTAHTCTAFTLSARKHPASGDDLIPPDGSLYFVKGMPESILGECRTHTAADGSAVPLNEAGKSQALAQSRRMAASGLRVLAMAYGPSLGTLTFAGIVGLEDPPREGVIESVAHLERSGVQVVMVTGDSKETAISIARRCGILGGGRGRSTTNAAKNGADISGGLLATIPPRSLNGGETSDDECQDLDALSDNSWRDDIEYGQHAMSGSQLDAIGKINLPDSIVGVKVFYRVAPRHKLALVRAFQKRGEVVAMTGDGVNDATALKVKSVSLTLIPWINEVGLSNSYSLDK